MLISETVIWDMLTNALTPASRWLGSGVAEHVAAESHQNPRFAPLISRLTISPPSLVVVPQTAADPQTAALPATPPVPHTAAARHKPPVPQTAAAPSTNTCVPLEPGEGAQVMPRRKVDGRRPSCGPRDCRGRSKSQIVVVLASTRPIVIFF
jgi:hypothetical protein